MKHISKITQKPMPAQMNLGDIFKAIGEILKVVGTLVVTKESSNNDPYDWSSDGGIGGLDLSNFL
ncbi:MAG: hypothetical protein GX117_02225 [Candidatus Hydrogenedentes bacterium]|jgi:hypothetical protein|nr:hypothetical protein [Candidatus Hydrogenedentota bacterium]